MPLDNIPSPRPGAPHARLRHPIPKPPTSPTICPTPLRLSTAPSAANNAGQPFTLGVYNRANKLPYSINFTLNIQYQPRNDLMIEIGYVGNLGRHQVIPVPFNQAQIATPGNPTHPGGRGHAVLQLRLHGVLDPNTFLSRCA